MTTRRTIGENPLDTIVSDPLAAPRTAIGPRTPVKPGTRDQDRLAAGLERLAAILEALAAQNREIDSLRREVAELRTAVQKLSCFPGPTLQCLMTWLRDRVKELP
jgi:hypothetical protein